jgi:polysaccharide deacetylase 2 family uncharacterized protein YibQ
MVRALCRGQGPDDKVKKVKSSKVKGDCAMGGGILSGIFWGGLVSAAVMVTLSLLAPLPQDAPDRAAVPTLAVPESAPDKVPDLSEARGPAERPAPAISAAPAPAATQDTLPSQDAPAQVDTASAPVPDTQGANETPNEPTTEVSVPAGSEFRRERPDTAPALPLTDRAPVKRLVEAPQPASPSAIPTTDTAPLPTPVTAGESVTALVDPPEQSPGPKFLAAPQDDVLPTPQPTEPQISGGDSLPQTDLETPAPPSAQVEVETSTLTGTAPAASPASIAQPDAPKIASGVTSETSSALSTGTALNAGSGESLLRVAPGRVVGTEVTPDAGSAAAPSAEVEPVVTASAASAAPQITPTAAATAEDTAQPTPEATSPTVAADTVVARDDTAASVADVATPDATASAAQAADQAVTATDAETTSAAAPESVSSAAAGAPLSAGQTTDQATQAEGDVAQTRADTDKEVVVGQVIPPVVSDRSPSADGIGVRVGTFTDRQAAASAAAAVEAETVTPEAEPATEQARLDALTRNAAVFEPTGDMPLFSVILIDVGSEGLDRDTLMTFTFPVTFAVDPTDPDAANTAKQYRAAGFEVLILANGIPDGATPQDIEVTLGSYLRQIPEAIGVLDLSSGGFATSQSLTQQAVSVLKEDGHGLILYEGGLNRAKQIADRAELSAGLAFRRLDDDGETGTTIRRYLDRAAFKAGQDGSVIMVGRSLPDTVTALFEWALTNRAGQVAMAPASAVLRAR